MSAKALTHRRRAAGIAVLLGLVLAVGVQPVLGWAARTDRVPVRDPQYTDKLALLRAHEVSRAKESETTLLFLGGSRTLDALDAGAVGPALTRQLGRRVAAFNFAQAGAGPVTNAVYLRRLLHDGMKPGAVVIEVHPAFLASQVNPPPEARWLAPTRLRPEELPLVRGYGFPAATPAAHGYRGWLAPCYEYRFLLLDRYAPPLSTLPYRMGAGHKPDRNGFVRVRAITPAERARLLELTRAQYADFMPGFQPGGCAVSAIRDTLETCRAAGIRAAILLTPESSEFRSWYAEPGRSRIAPLLAALGAEFGAPLFDARAWLPDELIGDGHHLTGAGADAFTERLTRESLAAWLSAPAGGTP